MLTWKDVAGADAYEIQERRDDWKTIWQAAGSPITITGLEYGVSYRHRIRSVRGSQTSAWVEVPTWVPLPYVGHQPDHTVRYVLSGIPTPAPGADASEDPGVVIPAAFVLAETAWNSVGAPPDVLFCKGIACGSNNTDGRTIPVSVVTNSETTRETNAPDAVAYLKPTAGGWADSAEHLKDLEMGIEHPPYTSRESLKWTNDPGLHDTRAGPNQRYEYLPATVMHEFGHAAGLYDLYKEAGIRDADEYTDYLMSGKVEKTKSGQVKPMIVPAPDRAYLRDTYRGHSPHVGASDPTNDEAKDT